MARLFYSELRLGLASVGGSNVGDFSRTRLHAGAEDVDDVVGDLHGERTGFTTDVLGLEGVDRFRLNEELIDSDTWIRSIYLPRENQIESASK